VVCGRQWGKTTTARLITLLGMGEPDSRTIYASLIRRNCKKLYWWPLLDELVSLGWGVHERSEDGRKVSNDTELIMEAPNGAWVQAVSCSEMSDLKTIRGDQADRFLVDECQEPNDDVLRALVLKVAVAMLFKRRGRLWLFGTVPEAEPCFFGECLDNPKWRTFGHSDVKGTECRPVFENLSIERAAIEEACDVAGLVPGHPIYEREVMGRRVRDPSKFAYEYLAGRNDYDPSTVDFDKGARRHSAGLDLASGKGYEVAFGEKGPTKQPDRDAIVVHSWDANDGEMRLYARFQWHHDACPLADLADILDLVREVYRPGATVGDHGGHGAIKVLADLAGKLRMLFRTKPDDVGLSVRRVNEDYRTGRLLHPTVDTETPRLLAALERRPWAADRKARVRKLLVEGTRTEDGKLPLSADVAKVTKSIDPRTRKVRYNQGAFHSDISEASRYAHHAARHWASKAPPGEPTDAAGKAEADICAQLEAEARAANGAW
jgi:hypothetical protein